MALLPRLAVLDARAEERLDGKDYRDGRDRRGREEHCPRQVRGGVGREADGVQQLLADEPDRRRHAGHRNARGNRGGERDGHGLPQAPEPRQIAGAGRLLDGPGDHEQGRLVQGVRDQECECRQEPPRRLALPRQGRRSEKHDAHAKRHDRGVGQHLFQIGFAQRHDCRVHRRHRSHGGQRLHPELGSAQQRREARQQEHTGLDHRRRMQVGRHRGRCRHRVRQPEVKWKLRRFGESPEHDQHDDRRVVRVVCETLLAGHHLPQAEGADGLAQDDEAGQHRQGARAGYEQSLQGGASGDGVLMRVADEQERSNRGELPEDEQRDEVVGQHHAEHRQHEADEKQGEPAALPIALHVLAGEQENERADSRNQQGEQQTQAVDDDAEVDAQLRQPRRLPDEDLPAGDRRNHRAEPEEERDRQGDGETHVWRGGHARIPCHSTRAPSQAIRSRCIQNGRHPCPSNRSWKRSSEKPSASDSSTSARSFCSISLPSEYST